MSDVDSIFPNNVVDALADHLVEIDGVADPVLKRSLAMTDPNGAVGVTADEWLPDEVEMAGGGNFEPTLATYFISIQHLVKHTNAEEGQRLHREIANGIRSMLYRGELLQLALRSLRIQEDDRIERILKWGVTRQRYASNDIEGTFTFLSATDFLVVTETVTV